MRTLIAVTLMLIGIIEAANAAESNYVRGTITSYTTTTDGLMLMTDGGIPTNCTGTPYGWLLIPEANKTMIATALTMLTTGNKTATFYTGGIVGPTSFCVIIQVEPSGF